MMSFDVHVMGAGTSRIILLTPMDLSNIESLHPKHIEGTNIVIVDDEAGSLEATLREIVVNSSSSEIGNALGIRVVGNTLVRLREHFDAIGERGGGGWLTRLEEEMTSELGRPIDSTLFSLMLRYAVRKDDMREIIRRAHKANPGKGILDQFADADKSRFGAGTIA